MVGVYIFGIFFVYDMFFLNVILWVEFVFIFGDVGDNIFYFFLVFLVW